MPAKFDSTTKYPDARPGGVLPPPKAKDDEAPAGSALGTNEGVKAAAVRPETQGFMGSSVFVFCPELARAMMDEVREKNAARKAGQAQVQEERAANQVQEECAANQVQAQTQDRKKRPESPAASGAGQKPHEGVPWSAQELPGISKNPLKPAARAAAEAKGTAFSRTEHTEAAGTEGTTILTWITKYLGSGSGSAVLLTSGVLTSGALQHKEVITSGSGLLGSGALGSGFFGSGFVGSGFLSSGVLSSGVLGSGGFGSGLLLFRPAADGIAESPAAMGTAAAEGTRPDDESAQAAEYAATAAFMALNVGAWYGLDILFNEIREPEFGIASEGTAPVRTGVPAEQAV